MPRVHIAVRDARRSDVEALLGLWATLREASGRKDRVLPPPSLEAAEQIFAALDADPLRRLVVAVVDGEVAGMALFSTDPLTPLLDLAGAQVDYVTVLERFRRRGVGRALVAAATAYAEDAGAEHVVINVFPGLRDANRFYARLGFTPLVVRRVASVAALRRRLAVTPTRGRDVLALRRTLRGRAERPGGGLAAARPATPS